MTDLAVQFEGVSKRYPHFTLENLSLDRRPVCSRKRLEVGNNAFQIVRPAVAHSPTRAFPHISRTIPSHAAEIHRAPGDVIGHFDDPHPATRLAP